jgi:hypothetical protein
MTRTRYVGWDDVRIALSDKLNCIYEIRQHIFSEKQVEWSAPNIIIGNQNVGLFGCWCLTPLSTIFQLYRGCQF